MGTERVLGGVLGGGLGGEGGGGVSVDLTPLLQWLLKPAGLTVVAVLILGLLLVVVVGALLVRRAIRRRLPAGRQLWDRASADWRAQRLPAGPRRELAELGAQLDEALAATAGQAQQLRSASAPVGNLPQLTEQLMTTGGVLREHLRSLEREPDQARLAMALPSATDKVEKWCSAAGSVREASRTAASAASTGWLQQLSSQVELEVASVQAGVDYLTERGRLDG